ncbi:lytic transglycosylase domain-containing protein [Olivibacter sitiensis]|uniref:lytic transglycosylase domain-containing protein n=1 Tax=Olivibacter sitiensis TaxID=376470 RepID=UPI000483350F|nr:lytic transglycosylase domain-containing protein [Olivibacter sitiensis]
MIKKHLLTCTLAVLCLIVSKLFMYGVPADRKTTKAKLTNVAEVVKMEDEEEETEGSTSSLNFAAEDMPTGDVKIEGKMERMLRAHSFDRLKTHRFHQKAKSWFPIIEPVLKAHGIPDDFKYIPLVESGLQQGVSHKGASGHWQFMPATARAFGLKVNGTVDERNNLHKSTVAACKYLKALYKEFGNWTLVAAAYNTGGGSLRRVMRHQGEDNYYKLQLNRETGSYVYKLISVKQIIENPQEHGYKARKPSSLMANNAEGEESNDQM